MELIDIVFKLVGSTIPLGDSSQDKERLNNLKTLCSLTEDLINHIDFLSQMKGQQHSVKESQIFARKFIARMVSENDTI